MQPSSLQIELESPSDAHALSQLSADAFGPGRFARSAYRVREGVPPVAELCLTARLGNRLIGSIRFTAVSIGDEPHALLLGPLVVDPAETGKGYGKALVADGLARAEKAGFSLVLLVGDMPYYGRFGFAPVPSGQMKLPGPVDSARLLAYELEPGALERANGPVKAVAFSGPRATR
ncbi:MAG: GNAT family N-acetyltransferase [Methyloceanibacter sp.]|uniref:GNAT family N-acetyltransferase n=1 Tax=Methyloceanibacter sp. TaxID=1965321 RepID=UPI003D9B829F